MLNKFKKKTFSVGILEILTMTLIILKLCKVISISWWWVFSPIWIPLALYILVFCICTAIIYYYSGKKMNENKKE